MNWGKGIVLGMAAFMLFILALSIRMMSSQTDDYDHDYYEKGLTFDEDYRKEKQVVLDRAQPVIQITAAGVSFQFKKAASGKVYLVRQADRRLDKGFDFRTDGNGLYVCKAKLPANGRWRTVIDWQSESRSYLYQQELWVP